MDLCNRCGACCRVLTVEQTAEEIQAIAAVTKVLGIPSDMIFAAQHWHPLTREEAMSRNPFYVARLPEKANLYWCDQLGADGLCMSHATRPLVCRGYPWYDQPVRDMALADADCGYAYDIVNEYVVRRPEM
ncbi:MAG TPA: YkgJ family cysteine cluster protein [Candidatus Acidoferrales bacterium]|nr:YkgJ family cysteine cluster protein [Candidatus Acidoferrales bacterium]